MANQNWVSLLNPASAQASGAGAALSTATTATISPTTGLGSDVAQVQPAALPYGWYDGMVIRFTARGFITTTATGTTVTFLLASRVGNTGSTYITLATTAGISTPAAANTGIPWELEGTSRCTAVATSGNTISTQFRMIIGVIAAQTILTGSADVVVFGPNASGETAAAVDTTQLQGLSMRATLAGANSTVQLSNWLVEAMD